MTPVLPVALLLVALPACRDADEKARHELQQSEFGFSIPDFLRAAESGETAAVTRFLDAGMNPDAADGEGRTALLAAAGAGHGHIVTLLLSRKASPEKLDRAGDTPLLAACRASDADTVRALLAAGAGAMEPDGRGRRPLDVAADLGRAEIVAVLAGQSGAEFSEAMRAAAAAGRTSVVDVLLNAGAIPDTLLYGGRTALMVAAENGQDAVVKLLCLRGADPQILTAEGKSAAALAADSHHPDTAAWLAVWPVRDAATARLPEPGGPGAENAGYNPAGAAPEAANTRPVSLAGVRRTQAVFPSMASLAEVFRMTGYRQKQYPFLLKEVAREHGSATLEMADGGKTITVKPGSAVPGTGLIVESLRRRYLYANGKDGDLVNVSSMTLLRERDRYQYRIGVDRVLMSTESVAELTLTETGERFEAEPGDEFRIGGALLRVEEVKGNGVTVINRVTKEQAVIPQDTTP